MCEERAYLGLGADVERYGLIPEAKILEAATVARRFARIARELGVASLDVIVTAPGRRATNGRVLMMALARATGRPVRILSAQEEGRLAFAGAVVQAEGIQGTVAVCDVGGGSTEILVGTARGKPIWCRSLELGSIHLTERFVPGDPPGKSAVAALRAEVEQSLAGTEPPASRAALATGGSARALRKLVGRTLGEEELVEAMRILRRRPGAQISRMFAIDPLRARTLLAGAVVLAEVQQLLGVPLTVARGGLREGAALELRSELAAA